MGKQPFLLIYDFKLVLFLLIVLIFKYFKRLGFRAGVPISFNIADHIDLKWVRPMKPPFLSVWGSLTTYWIAQISWYMKKKCNFYSLSLFFLHDNKCSCSKCKTSVSRTLWDINVLSYKKKSSGSLLVIKLFIYTSLLWCSINGHRGRLCQAHGEVLENVKGQNF